MREFKKRRTGRAEIMRYGMGFLGLLALVAIAFVAGRAAWGMYGKFAEAAGARAGAEAELTELQDRHKKIQTEVDSLSSPRGLEAEVRERYGVAKPGEGEIRVVRQSTTTEIVRQNPGIFETLWQLLFVW